MSHVIIVIIIIPHASLPLTAYELKYITIIYVIHTCTEEIERATPPNNNNNNNIKFAKAPSFMLSMWHEKVSEAPNSTL